MNTTDMRDQRHALRAAGSRIWRLVCRVLAGLAFAGVTAAGGLWWYATTLGPLDLSVAADRSTVVEDRSGHLLRAFATGEGR